ncbi:hypothetical protein [Zunongwangia atlantica]|uniref:Secreted protein n=1 Tax=Zunongwangia atlantica 22II14-10F7 TaxID=1185767 RepID=A0A1Y1SZ94_9FLAO|nr:hypothetical protein [Zunongwangia atlantica]ORL44078.1 hypothetical protein IIF7_17842 [Zunongwangia atlantica 22II14-10F7]
MKKTLYILIYLIGVSSIAQNFDNISNTGMLIFTKAKTPDEYTGSPYVEDEFTQGKIVDVDKNRSQTAYLKFNAIEDVVEIKLNKDDEKVHILPKLKNLKYDMGDYNYIIDNYRVKGGGNLEGYFLEYFYEDNIRFLAFPEGKLTPATTTETGYQKPKPANLRIDYTYYIQRDLGPLEEVKLKNRDFKEIFADEDLIQSYIKKNKIKTESDVVLMLKYYINNN